MIIGLCFSLADKNGPSTHTAVGATHARWPEGSWLAVYAYALCNVKLIAAGKQVLASICSSYR
jgi:hypothetical protein